MHYYDNRYGDDNNEVGGYTDSSETDSDEESKMPNYRKKQRRRANQGNSVNVPFTADNLIERPGKVLSSLFNQLSLKSQSPGTN